MSGLSRSEEKLVRGLSRRKLRESEGLFLAEGIRVVEDLLDAGIAPRLAVVSPALEETERGRGLLGRLEGSGTVRRVGNGDLLELADTRTTQGVLVTAPIPSGDIAGVRPGRKSAVLVLDGVQDPGNLGTLTRTAAAFGCDALVCLPGTVDPWNPKAVRASAGALFRLPVVSADPATAGAWLEAGEFVVLGADAGGDAVEATAVPARTALVVGNEGAGLSAEARALCSRLIAVPMREGTESLNVAVATSILLYLLTRGRA